ncbi:MAG: HAD family phosphatase [Trueperaceae bacterium]|nr:HAD family phosphatase [Trueperaceae bacterium]
MIPLVVVDLDGTIVGADGQVRDCVWKAVSKLTDAGVRVAACTGRPGFGTARKIAERLGPNNPHVFQSGAQISFAEGPTLKTSALPGDALETIIEVSRRHNAVLELYTPMAVFVERKTKLSEDHAKLIGASAVVTDLSDVAAGEPVVRGQWVVAAGQEAKLLAALPAGVTAVTASSPALPGVAFVSLTRAGVSKASAVAYIAEHQRVPLADVMAIGDSSGDLPMLEIVGHPRVMGNSSPELLERYPSVGDVDECGAVTALEEALTLRVARA